MGEKFKCKFWENESREFQSLILLTDHQCIQIDQLLFHLGTELKLQLVLCKLMLKHEAE